MVVITERFSYILRSLYQLLRVNRKFSFKFAFSMHPFLLSYLLS